MINLDHLQELFCRLYVDCYGVGFHHRDHAIYQSRKWLLDEIAIMLEDTGKTTDLEKEAAKMVKRDAKVLEHIIRERSKARPLYTTVGEFWKDVRRNTK